jgi:hypoxanthine phosphoribosyltransferase
MAHLTDRAIDRVLFDAAAIQAAVDSLADRIAADYRGEPVLLVGVLKGALLFTADLARAVASRYAEPGDVHIDFIAVTSYGNATTSSGHVRLLKDVSETIQGRNVIIVEDIVDNGRTLAFLQAMLGQRSPKSLRSCVLLDKPFRRIISVPVEYVGLDCPDTFIVGYGLDYQERYRALPFLAKLHEWVLDE